MIDLSEIQTAYYMLAATGVLVAAIYDVYTMRINQKNQKLALKAQEQTLETRQVQRFMQLYQDLLSEDALRSYLELLNME